MRAFSFFCFLQLFMTISCGKSATNNKLAWDLSTSNRTEQVKWPNDVNGDSWTIDGPGVIRLKIRGGIEHDIPFSLVQIDRKGERLRSLRILTPFGTLDQVYGEAVKLADDWDFKDRRSIENFKKTNGYRVLNAGGEGSVNSDAEQPRLLQIQQSFSRDEPWCISMYFGFLKDFDLNKSSPLGKSISP